MGERTYKAAAQCPVCQENLLCDAVFFYHGKASLRVRPHPGLRWEDWATEVCPLTVTRRAEARAVLERQRQDTPALCAYFERLSWH